MRAGTVGAAWVVALLLLVVVVVVVVAPRAQAADRAFAARYATNDTGDIAFAANTTMTCPAAATGCAAAQAGVDTGPVAPTNNSFRMAYVDVDADPSTFSSSRSTLSLPAGATVLFAGLYWGGDSSSAARNQVRLATPTAPAYQTLTAQQLDIPTVNVSRYQGFRDVTGLVQAGGNGSYTVANVQSSTVSDRYGGWTLVVAYRDSAHRRATSRSSTASARCPRRPARWSGRSAASARRPPARCARRSASSPTRATGR